MAAGAQSRFGGALLTTRFGRRIFLMFCMATLVPAAAVYWMTYRASSGHVTDIARASLQALNKSYALGVFQRLQTAQQALAEAAVHTPAGGPAPAGLRLFFTDVDAGRTPSAGPHPPSAGGLPGARARSAAARLVVSPTAGLRGDHGVAVRAGVPGDPARMLTGRLRPDYLWGLPDELGDAVHICAFADDRPLFCGGGVPPPSSEHTESRWSLFLKPTFEADSWTFVATTRAPEVLAAFPRLVVPVMAGVLLLALLLSSFHIRRVLVPLDALLARIRTSGGGASAVPAGDAADEFGVLSHTFDALGGRIGRQMETLHTLSEVDRLILARVPLARVVERVARRIRELVPAATVGVLLAELDASGRGEWHQLARGSVDMEVVETDGRPLLVAAGAQPGAGGSVMALEALRESVAGTHLHDLGDTHALVLTLRGEHPAGVHVLLGFGERPNLGEELQAGLVDLAERVAVAAAFHAHEQRLVHQARNDLLTGLPNRLATYEGIAAAIADAAGTDSFAVVFLDLDRFKVINDGLGHGVGDDILLRSGQRIRAALAPGDFLGRFGGDEFLVILRGVASRASVAATLDRVASAFEQPLVVANREFVQHFSAGVAFHPGDGADAATLIRNADVAMYRAKRSGGRGSAFFDQSMNEDARARLQMEGDLRLAIERGDIRIHYQPRVDSRTGRIVGAEALARWAQPGAGDVSPQVFIALAEQCGLIDALGRLVLDGACRQLADWKRDGVDPGVIGVNISGHQLRSGRLLDDVQGAMRRWGIEPAALELEVTETVMVQDSHSARAQLQALREHGLSIAIDDFGTGYSSLAYLTQLPSDTLKIDRAFVVDLLDGDPGVEAVVRSIIAIARDLGKHIVAEGVESMGQVEQLATWGCHVIQGYVYWQPLAADAMTALLAARQVDWRASS